MCQSAWSLVSADKSCCVVSVFGHTGKSGYELVCMNILVNNTVECRCYAFQFITILQMALQWQHQDENQTSNSQRKLYTSPSRACYGLSIMRILKKIDRVITALHCTTFILSLGSWYTIEHTFPISHATLLSALASWIIEQRNCLHCMLLTQRAYFIKMSHKVHISICSVVSIITLLSLSEISDGHKILE